MKTIDFNDNVELRFMAESKEEVLLKDLWIRTKVFNEKLKLKSYEYFVFKIPKGVVTDGASIPKALWIFINPFDNRILVPSQPHDYLYHLKDKKIKGYKFNKSENKITDEELEVEYTRKEADQLIREKMKSYGGGPFLRFCVYWAVRLFGFRSY